MCDPTCCCVLCHDIPMCCVAMYHQRVFGIGALSKQMFCNPIGSVRFMGNDNGL